MQRTSVSPILPLIVLVLFAQAAWAGDALSFFNNWFVTGDYAVSGVGLRGTGVNGWATGAINMTGVPGNAEPVAAFLYWSTAESTRTPSARIGYFNGHEIQAAVLGSSQNPSPACWSSGGTTGPQGTAGFVYRADVLRYLPVNAGNVRLANGPQTVKLPDSGGNGNGNVVFTNGASLVVIYRVVTPGNPASTPLRAVVIYDGIFTMDSHSAGMTQNVAGFYQAASNPAARITGIVANGQPGFSSPFTVNGTSLGTSPFVGAQGARWDNFTSNFALAANSSVFPTQLTVGNNQTCLTTAALVASMNVQDSDGDGLLDVWESNGLHRNTQVSPATFGTCSDYPAEPCVNLPAMGALPGTKDIFVQIDWMNGYGDGTGGVGGAGLHDHMPKLPALKQVADAFAAAPHGIHVHFDVGNHYQGIQPECSGVCSFIIPAVDGQGGVPNAQGGSDIDENSLVCHDTAAHPCNYHVPYPVLSFEFGFASVRDGNHLLGISPHFAQNRKDIFHYGLFAHALGGPYDINGHPVDPHTGEPTNVPLSYSGIAHRPGGGFMVSLGLWRSDIPENDQVGSVQVQAGTLMHELGHNLDLSHAGLSTQPNCMPNYPSVMNYLYQTRGLTDAAGNEHVDYSNGGLSGFSVVENSLNNTNLGLATPYRIRFYGPLVAGDPPGAVSQLHCDGTPITDGTQETRLESPAPGTPDWSNGTVPGGSPFSYDVNFDGTTGGTFTDQPDWNSLNLQQIGAGYRFGGLSLGAFATDGGVFATDGGVFATDAGALATDGGVFATDGGAFATDGGAFATDGGVFATDGGVFATDGGAFATDAGDLDFRTVVLSSVDAPGGLTATPTLISIVLNWTPPDTGNIDSYNIYRCAVISPAVSCTPAAFKTISGGIAAASFTDSVNDFASSGAACGDPGKTCYNTTYIYSVTSVVHGVESGFSKTASGIVKHLFIKADDKTRVYGAPNPTLTFTTTGLDPGLTGTTICTTIAGQSSNVGDYPINCSGLTPAAGVTYTPGTLHVTKANATITVSPYHVTYNAAAHTATGRATGVNGEDLTAGLNLTGTTHTNAGDYPSDTWSFSGGTNYNDANGIVHDIIDKANATIVVTAYSVPYNGSPHTATGKATGVNSVDLSAGLTLTGTTHTNAGDYPTDGWSFSGGINYNDANGTIHDQILYLFTLSPLKSPATLGSAIPIGWTLQGNPSGPITSMSTLVEMDSVFNGASVPRGGCVASNVGVSAILYKFPIGATGNSNFRYASGFTFNWDTTTAGSTGKGCYTVILSLDDGSKRMTNAVQLK
jgi:hypothetical protein